MKNYYAGFLLLLLSMNAFPQFKDFAPNFPSPNAYNLGLFGEIPTDLFTGNPNINIPIYELDYGSVKVPVSLAYHPAGVKANHHPGWVGLGWSLKAGGAITRVQRGFIDEWEGKNDKKGFFYNYHKLDAANWSDQDQIKKYAEAQTDYNNMYDVRADEFYFCFLGYSGKFMMNHKGEWEVISDQQIRVVKSQPSDIVSVDELRAPFPQKVMDKIGSIKYLNKLTLIDPDGIRYEFGGINAVEYSGYRSSQTDHLIPTSWYLSEIIMPDGRTVQLEYTAGHMICSLSHSYHFMRTNSPDAGFLSPGCKSVVSGVMRKPANGYLIFPVYLKSISTPLCTIDFSCSRSDELKYSSYDLEYDTNEDPEAFYHYFMRYSTEDELKWWKLDKIRIKAAGFEREYELNYINNPQERLKLRSVREKNLNLNYEFAYNPTPLTPYCTDQCDHWGYYNGMDPAVIQSGHTKTVDDWILSYPALREPDVTGFYQKAEILERIYYPTRGYTVFEYEPHSYSSVVNPERTSLSGNNGICGGLRIRKISSYSREGAIPATTEFLYVKNYRKGTTNLSSSGTLAGRSQYSWFGYKGRDESGKEFRFDMFTSGSLLPAAVAAHGSHIGYSEVIEKSEGNGYKKYTFTNFDTDIWGTSHIDEAAVAWIDPQRSIYSPFTCKALERGKLTSETVYDEAGIMVKEVKSKYERSHTGYLRGLDLSHFNICSNVSASAQTWYGTAFRIYTCNFNLTEKTETVSGVKTLTTYKYNGRNQLSEVSVTSSDGRKQVTCYTYPPDIPAGSDPELMREMTEKNMINNRVDMVSYWVNGQASMVTSAGHNCYKQFSPGIYRPWRIDRFEPDRLPPVNMPNT